MLALPRATVLRISTVMASKMMVLTAFESKGSSVAALLLLLNSHQQED